MGKKLNITEDSLRAELAKYLGPVEPIIPEGRGYTIKELALASGIPERSTHTRLQEQLDAGKVKEIGVRGRGRVKVYEAV